MLLMAALARCRRGRDRPIHGRRIHGLAVPGRPNDLTLKTARRSAWSADDRQREAAEARASITPAVANLRNSRR